jgi:hypothetical protein
MAKMQVTTVVMTPTKIPRTAILPPVAGKCVSVSVQKA